MAVYSSLSHGPWDFPTPFFQSGTACRQVADALQAYRESGSIKGRASSDNNNSIIIKRACFIRYNKVSRCGLALRRRRTLVRSASALLSLLFKKCGLWTLSCDFCLHSEWNIKTAHTTAHLYAESFSWWQCGELVLGIKYMTPPTPLPTSPSLISLNGFCGRKAQCYFGRIN